MSERIDVEALYPNTLYIPDVEEIWDDATALHDKMKHIRGFVDGLTMSLSPQDGSVSEFQKRAIEAEAHRSYKQARERREELMFVAKALDRARDESIRR